MSKIAHQFLRFFSDPAPALCVKFRESDLASKIVPVQHRLGLSAAAPAHDFLDSLPTHPNVSEFREFYCQHDGAEICRTSHARYREDCPLLELKPAQNITEFTNRYLPGGELAWIMDLNKSKGLYRSSNPWIAFAEINTGPACLTMFLEGQNAGYIYYATPQPPFNILRPIARDFPSLLERIGRDLPAFLRLVRATVVLRGVDGDNYGYMPTTYIGNAKDSEAQA